MKKTLRSLVIIIFFYLSLILLMRDYRFDYYERIDYVIEYHSRYSVFQTRLIITEFLKIASKFPEIMFFVNLFILASCGELLRLYLIKKKITETKSFIFSFMFLTSATFYYAINVNYSIGWEIDESISILLFLIILHTYERDKRLALILTIFTPLFKELITVAVILLYFFDYEKTIKPNNLWKRIKEIPKFDIILMIIPFIIHILLRFYFKNKIGEQFTDDIFPTHTIRHIQIIMSEDNGYYTWFRFLFNILIAWYVSFPIAFEILKHENRNKLYIFILYLALIFGYGIISEVGKWIYIFILLSPLTIKGWGNILEKKDNIELEDN